MLSRGFLTYNYCCTLPLTVLSLCVSFTVTIINCYCSYAFHRFLLNFPFWYHMKHKKTTGFLIFRGSKGTLTLKSFIMNFREFLFHRKAISDFIGIIHILHKPWQSSSTNAIKRRKKVFTSQRVLISNSSLGFPHSAVKFLWISKWSITQSISDSKVCLAFLGIFDPIYATGLILYSQEIEKLISI